MADETNATKDIATWVRSDASRPYCSLPWHQMTVLSDGSAVCACIDAAKTNPLGSFRRQSFEEVWDGESYRQLRRNIAEDIDRTPICRGCPHRREGPPPPEGYDHGVPKPRALFIESYAGCNLACPGCDREGIEGSRESLSMDYDVYCKIIDSLAPSLSYMEFHLGGENWMHKRSADMIRYCKEQNDNCAVLTSTNGHFFHTDDRVKDAVECGLDCIIFSIDGSTQESYEKYRVKGDLERALDGMRRMVRIRNELGLERPFLVWRYILFHWNDSPELMDRAREMADEIGVDALCWSLNSSRPEDSSPRYYVGSPELAKIEKEMWDYFPQSIGLAPAVDFSEYPAPISAAD